MEPPVAAIRDFVWASAVFAIVVILFFGTLSVLQNFPGRMAFADEAQSLMEALQDYRGEFGAYPVLPEPDSPIAEVKQALAKAGHPVRTSALQDEDARYVSFDGKSYGLLFHRGLRYVNRPVIACIVEVNAANTGWWGQFARCRL